MITKINPNIQFNYYELNNHIDNILVYLVNKSFTMNTKLLSINKLDDDYKFHIRRLIVTEYASPSNDIRFIIKNNLIESFKKAHYD
jgi:hypothetical protein